VNGDDYCELFPWIGGSIGKWNVQGQPMFREPSLASIDAKDPYGMGSFPLVPYSNRIGYGEFEWMGQAVRLRRNFPPEPHAIHGVGFERPWTVQSRTASSAELTLSHDPDDSWPWSFKATQRVILANKALQLRLSVANLERHAVPLGFGHHPYFPKRGAHLTFTARQVWTVGANGLPSGTVSPSGRFDFREAKAVEPVEVDHCFSGWQGPARISWLDRPLALEIDHSRELSSAVLFIRKGADGFCFEPVPHVNNALNSQGGESAMPTIAAGETYSASIDFRAVPQ
jgi:aldose 1-epimerase